ncbi:MAG: hypothetical protein M0Q95_20375 [Porticoccaceae bacterium]|nr:hypothetical protein [Porticoccaceae bacterium]
MNKSGKGLWLWLFLATALLGCEEETQPAEWLGKHALLLDTDAQSDGLADEEAGASDAGWQAGASSQESSFDVNESVDHEQRVGEVATEAPVSIVVDGMSKGEMNTDVLKWRLSNVIDESIVIVPTLLVEGLATVSQSEQMAIVTLATKRDADVVVAATDFPVQSMVGAGTVQLELAVSTLDNPEHTVKVLSPMYYYRHVDAYQKVVLFTEDVLMKKHQGKIFEISDAQKNQNAEIGRIKEGKGQFKTLLAQDFLSSSENQLSITGIGLSREYDDEKFLERIAENNNKSATSGTYLPYYAEWSVNWTDGEGTAVVVPARYTRAKLYNQSVSPERLEWSGWLDDQGQAIMPTLPNTKYKFSLGTAVHRNLNNRSRYIYAQLPDDESCGLTYISHNLYFTTGETLPSGRFIRFPASTPSSRIAALGQLAMHRATLLQWEPTWTLIAPSNNPPHQTSHYADYACVFDGRPGQKIYIDTQFQNPNGGSGNLDHSTYQYIIGHEMGHRQAWDVGGVMCQNCSSTPLWSNQNTAHPCNCKKFTQYNDTCFQYVSYTGNRQREAYANFYSAALRNGRTATCNWRYWRNMYKKNPSGGASWQPLAPVPWNCAQRERWMATFCSAESMTNKATNQDWMSFFWNVWTTSTNPLSIADINAVWHDTVHVNNNVGYQWSAVNPNAPSLERSARLKWGQYGGKYLSFIDEGFNARVNY